jgi:hypothetical protein
LKIHGQAPNQVVGACDEDCLGKTLENPDFYFVVNEAFYKDQLLTLEEAKAILARAANFNVVGNHIIETLIAEGIIHQEGIIKINEIPVAIRMVF